MFSRSSPAASRGATTALVALGPASLLELLPASLLSSVSCQHRGWAGRDPSEPSRWGPAPACPAEAPRGRVALGVRCLAAPAPLLRARLAPPVRDVSHPGQSELCVALSCLLSHTCVQRQLIHVLGRNLLPKYPLKKKKNFTVKQVSVLLFLEMLTC